MILKIRFVPQSKPWPTTHLMPVNTGFLKMGAFEIKSGGALGGKHRRLFRRLQSNREERRKETFMKAVVSGRRRKP